MGYLPAHMKYIPRPRYVFRVGSKVVKMAKQRREYRRMYWPRSPRELACIFTVHFRNKGSKGKPWIKEYVEETKDPDAWARELIDKVNKRLTPGDVEIELVYVIRRGRCAPQRHRWVKTSNYAEVYKCSRCTITGHKEDTFSE